MASGSDTGCSAHAFFVQWTIMTPIYNASLSLYYVLVVKLGWNERKLQNIRWLFHLFPVGISLGTAIAGALLDIYGNATLWCWIVPGSVYRWAFYVSFKRKKKKYFDSVILRLYYNVSHMNIDYISHFFVFLHFICSMEYYGHVHSLSSSLACSLFIYTYENKKQKQLNGNGRQVRKRVTPILGKLCSRGFSSV